MAGSSVTDAWRRIRNATSTQRRRCLRKQRQYGSYVWKPLSTNEIRILTLFPGHFKDEIRIQIAHTQLFEASASSRVRMTRRELQATLPPCWTVEEALGRRYIFIEEPRQNEISKLTWTHPDPEFDHSRYAVPSSETPGPTNTAYEALSYAWGSQDDPELAFAEDVNGICIGTVSIGRNLDMALRHLRYENKPRRLWIDAICINQSDDDEKSVQVRQMPRIYRSAHRVIAWIGPETEGSDLAMANLKYLGSQIITTLPGWIMWSPEAQEPDWYHHDEELPYSNETWEAIRTLLQRQWFSRRWVFQEITLANPSAILQCGRSEVSWPLFRGAIRCLNQKHTLPASVYNVLGDVNDVVTYGNGGQAGQLLENLKTLECSDQRDVVYALLGIMPSRLASIVEVDYAVSPADAFRSFFLAHVGHVQRWELFGGVLKERMCGGPS